MTLGLILFQPEIAANLGAAIRSCVCFGAHLGVIEPCGFPWKSREIDRVAMDYGSSLTPVRHHSWAAFQPHRPARLILLTTKAETPLHAIALKPGDHFLLGQESAGVPEDIHNAADLRVVIPLAPGARSLNMAMAGTIALAEARRQIGWPKDD